MPTGFPPTSQYPYGIDTDYNLYKVYNTSEAELTSNNSAWAEEVPIKPQPSGKLEIWADNGFATIAGEMFYYDAVDKNADGHVYNLKRCVRNLGGTHTQFNLAGTMVRGFVMAEHHNQLADTIMRVENFVGENFSPDVTTLDYRIRHLQRTPIIFDDFDCPSVSFTFNILSIDPSSGTVTSYHIQISGTFTNFVLDFGDGTSTKSAASGTHTYAPNANIDPIITISNDQCQIVQSPINRTATTTPRQLSPDVILDLPIPVCPNIGDIFIPPVNIPIQDIVIPPIIFPELNLNSLPSALFGPISISLGGFKFPSAIEITAPNIPVFSSGIISITFPEISISITGPSITVDFPSIPNISVIVPPFPNISVDINISVPPFPNISVVLPPFPNISVVLPPFPNISVVLPPFPNISVTVPPFPDINVVLPPFPEIFVVLPPFPTISIVAPVFPTINIGPFPPAPTVGFDNPPCVPMCWGEPPIIQIGPFPAAPRIGFDSPPCVPVCWGTPPTIPINVTVTCNCACCPPASSTDLPGNLPLGMNLLDPVFLDEFNPFMPVDMNSPLDMNYDIQGIPSVIIVQPPIMPDIKITHEIPSSISLHAPDKMIIEYIGPPIPSVIQLLSPVEPVKLVYEGPKTIKIDASDVPEAMKLIVPDTFPMIMLDTSSLPSAIQVVGCPSVIEIIGMPDTIRLEMPDNPTVQMLPPIDPIPISVMLTLSLDGIQKMIAEQQKGQKQCFSLEPCNPN